VAASDGNLWFAETGGANALGRITPAGSIAEYQIRRTTPRPQGICLGPDGNIYFTELSTNKVGRISNLMGGGTVKPGLTMTGPPPGMACTNDTDCIGAGHGCGGDVCSATSHTCVSSASNDPGTCSTRPSAGAWHKGPPATPPAHHCSLTLFDPASLAGGGTAP